MLPSTIVRALTTPAFEPEQFVATQWSTTEDKAKFANALMKFIAHEFPRQSFSKALYQRLSNTFGHIAHTSQDGVVTLPNRERELSALQELSGRCDCGPPRGHRVSAKDTVRLG